MGLPVPGGAPPSPPRIDLVAVASRSDSMREAKRSLNTWANSDGKHGFDSSLVIDANREAWDYASRAAASAKNVPRQQQLDGDMGPFGREDYLTLCRKLRLATLQLRRETEKGGIVRADPEPLPEKLEDDWRADSNGADALSEAKFCAAWRQLLCDDDAVASWAPEDYAERSRKLCERLFVPTSDQVRWREDVDLTPKQP